MFHKNYERISEMLIKVIERRRQMERGHNAKDTRALVAFRRRRKLEVPGLQKSKRRPQAERG